MKLFCSSSTMNSADGTSSVMKCNINYIERNIIQSAIIQTYYNLLNTGTSQGLYTPDPFIATSITKLFNATISNTKSILCFFTIAINPLLPCNISIPCFHVKLIYRHGSFNIFYKIKQNRGSDELFFIIIIKIA